MKRSCAREIAVRMCFLLSMADVEAKKLLQEFFDKSYYDTLASEDEVFSDFPDPKQREYIEKVICGIDLHHAELDDYVAKYAKGWKFERVSRTALAIMKVAMYEILYMPEIPNATAINEAVEIAKKYEEPKTIAFVNGVLGSFLREEAEKI